MKKIWPLMLLLVGMALALGADAPSVQNEIILPSIKIEKQAPRSSFEETLVVTKSQTEGMSNASALASRFQRTNPPARFRLASM